ncbi:hypothetical protein RHECNPAF_1760012 [Rhizobium etli CNPAF512]|nr:hypothetical protein RHECNPAF_1760012 [Rhizobium etli CNPAF512]
MAMAGGAAQRLLHFRQLDEAERSCDVDGPAERDFAGDRVDEFSKAARFLHCQIDALHDLHGVRRIQNFGAAELEELRLDALDQVGDIVQFGHDAHQDIAQRFDRLGRLHHRVKCHIKILAIKKIRYWFRRASAERRDAARERRFSGFRRRSTDIAGHGRRPANIRACAHALHRSRSRPPECLHPSGTAWRRPRSAHRRWRRSRSSWRRRRSLPPAGRAGRPASGDR